MKWGWSSRLPVKAFGSNNGLFLSTSVFFGFSPLAGQGGFLSNLVFWCNSRLSRLLLSSGAVFGQFFGFLGSVPSQIVLSGFPGASLALPWGSLDSSLGCLSPKRNGHPNVEGTFRLDEALIS